MIDANQTTLMSIMIFMRNLMIGKYHKYPLGAIKENIIITITNNKLKNQNKRVSKQSNETKQKKIFTQNETKLHKLSTSMILWWTMIMFEVGYICRVFENPIIFIF